MSNAEKFIQDYTRNCSNVMESPLYVNPKLNFYPWLTPDQARRAVEIARGEMIDWIQDNIGEYCYGNYLGFSAISIENIDLFDQKSFISDLRKAIKDE